MLEHSQQAAASLSDDAALEPRSTLVEAGDDFFAKAGRLPAAYDELRRFPRYYYRSCADATIYPLRGRGANEPQCCMVRTRDLSRSGLGVLAPQQLFPGQRLDLVLNGQTRPLEVMWCRRLGPDSYLCGCKFVAAPEAGGQ